MGMKDRDGETTISKVLRKLSMLKTGAHKRERTDY
jgi:hypothetical protein